MPSKDFAFVVVVVAVAVVVLAAWAWTALPWVAPWHLLVLVVAVVLALQLRNVQTRRVNVVVAKVEAWKLLEVEFDPPLEVREAT